MDGLPLILIIVLLAIAAARPIPEIVAKIMWDKYRKQSHRDDEEQKRKHKDD